MSAHEEVRELLSAYLDDELTQRDSQLVRVHLETCNECRQTLDQLRTLQQATATTRFRKPTEEEMEKLETRMSVQAPRKAGWLLLLTGVAVWAIYGVYLFLTDPDLLTFENLSSGAIVVGLALLLISVLRQRLLELPYDRYRGVKRMIVVTTDSIAGKRIVRTLGLVRGNTVRARHLGRDIMAALRGIVGGEVHEYTKLLAESLEQAVDQMVSEAQSLGANAIVRTLFITSYIAANMAELLAYGTAVVVEDD